MSVTKQELSKNCRKADEKMAAQRGQEPSLWSTSWERAQILIQVFDTGALALNGYIQCMFLEGPDLVPCLSQV